MHIPVVLIFKHMLCPQNSNTRLIKFLTNILIIGPTFIQYDQDMWPEEFKPGLFSIHHLLFKLNFSKFRFALVGFC